MNGVATKFRLRSAKEESSDNYNQDSGRTFVVFLELFFSPLGVIVLTATFLFCKEEFGVRLPIIPPSVCKLVADYLSSKEGTAVRFRIDAP